MARPHTTGVQGGSDVRDLRGSYLVQLFIAIVVALHAVIHIVLGLDPINRKAPKMSQTEQKKVEISVPEQPSNFVNPAKMLSAMITDPNVQGKMTNGDWETLIEMIVRFVLGIVFRK